MTVVTNGLNEYRVDTTLIDCPCLHRIMAENHDECERQVKQLYDEAHKEWLIRVAMERWIRQNYGWQALDHWWSKKDQMIDQILRELVE